MRPGIRTSHYAILLTMLLPGTASAQILPGGYEVGFGIARSGGSGLGTVAANETTADGGARRLFSSRSRLGGGNAFEARFGVKLTETLRLEAGGSYGTSTLSVSLSSDVEGLPDVVATESIQQFALGGALLMELPQWQIGSRAVPFLAAGGGYVRDLHEDRVFGEDGWEWHLGGGANVLLRARPDGWMKMFGVRVEGRYGFVTGGAAFDDDPHGRPRAGVSAFLRF